MFTFSRTENPSYAVLLLQDRDTQRVYRLYDFTEAPLIRPGVAHCVAGKVNKTDKLHHLIESVRRDTTHARFSTVPAPAGGAGGSALF